MSAANNPFNKKWNDTFIVSLKNFMSTIFHQLRKPFFVIIFNIVINIII